MKKSHGNKFTEKSHRKKSHKKESHKNKGLKDKTYILYIHGVGYNFDV